MADSFSTAMTNRSLRSIRTELEFLLDANVITSQQFDIITSQLPAHAGAAAARSAQPMPSPAPMAAPVQAVQSALSNLNFKKDEKKAPTGGYYANDATSNPPPPAYPVAPAAPIGPTVLCHATALYQYNAQDAGDLALMPNDKIVVHEYMNNEWWKGMNERTGCEGIFPASYVRKEEGKSLAPGPPAPSNYGNMPLDVSNGAASQPQEPSKMEANGKKFGKKLGNAAIFGAGKST